MKTAFSGIFSKLALVALVVAPTMVYQGQAMAQQTRGGGWVNPDERAEPNIGIPQGEEGWSDGELAQLLAPVALYPDQLLAQVLTASTYPLEVVEADRWVSDPRNAGLKGEALGRAVESKDWSPSVKSLVQFPEVLHMMSSKLDWMQDLGEAFLAQEGDVMAMVQQLRQDASASGTLRSTPEQIVREQDQAILIVPANPQVVYVPYYDPLYAYGAWDYPGYQPYYFGGPAYVGRPGLFFGNSSMVLSMLWGWSDWDWRYRRLNIHTDRYNRLNYHRPPISSSIWTHDPYHRRGVYYQNTRIRDRFEGSNRGGPNGYGNHSSGWRQDRDRSSDWNRMRERNPALDQGGRRGSNWQGSTRSPSASSPAVVQPQAQPAPTTRERMMQNWREQRTREAQPEQARPQQSAPVAQPQVERPAGQAQPDPAARERMMQNWREQRTREAQPEQVRPQQSAPAAQPQVERPQYQRPQVERPAGQAQPDPAARERMMQNWREQRTREAQPEQARPQQSAPVAQPQVERPQYQRPQMDRPQGERPQVERSQGERPQRDGGDRGRGREER
ncbi:DUF3300 domain-containing protein [Govanella unica]|uniref:DUF3300 domain-containing protein n=1 Tax=Govanella unica TaxID=2975056 RepID=A0A9X3Z6P8_9PROT|nr:DUF3300 domain-containing protein [Govania unica]MDA5193307.1 DUF3300 domain-containing protein [Govania unica]